MVFSEMFSRISEFRIPGCFFVCNRNYIRNIFADFEKSHGRYVVCDFVCPTKETRENFSADIVIWMDTIKEGRYEDTNKLFQDPERVDFHIKEWNEHNHDDIAKEILKNV